MSRTWKTALWARSQWSRKATWSTLHPTMRRVQCLRRTTAPHPVTSVAAPACTGRRRSTTADQSLSTEVRRLDQATSRADTVPAPNQGSAEQVHETTHVQTQYLRHWSTFYSSQPETTLHCETTVSLGRVAVHDSCSWTSVSLRLPGLMLTEVSISF